MRPALLALALVLPLSAAPAATACDAADRAVDAVVTDLHGNRLATLPGALVHNPCSGTQDAELHGGLVVAGGPHMPHAVLDWRHGGAAAAGATYSVNGDTATRHDLATGANESWQVPGLPQRVAHGLAFGLADRLRVYDLEARAWVVDLPAGGLAGLGVAAASHGWVLVGNATELRALRLPGLQETARIPWSLGQRPLAIDGDDLWVARSEGLLGCCATAPRALGWTRIHLPNGAVETGPSSTLLDADGGHLLFADLGGIGGAWGEPETETSPSSGPSSAPAPTPAPAPAAALPLAALALLAAACGREPRRGEPL